MGTISLSRFCDINRLAKTTVHTRCKELQISTSNGLTPEDQKTLLRAFGLDDDEDDELDELPVTETRIIPFGNDNTKRTLHVVDAELPPELDINIAIERFSGLRPSALKDPEQAVMVAMRFNNMVVEGLRQKGDILENERKRIARLTNKLEANIAVTERAVAFQQARITEASAEVGELTENLNSQVQATIEPGKAS